MTEVTGEEAVQRAQQRRCELEEEIRQIDLFLSLYQQFARDPVSAGTTVAPEAPDVLNASRGRKRAGGGMSQEDFIGMAREFLLEIGRPVNGRTLLEKFREKGRQIGGVDEFRNFNTKIWRARDRITKIPGAGYWPVDVPCPEVSYAPSPDAVGETGGEPD
jgi:hypothetical protein